MLMGIFVFVQIIIDIIFGLMFFYIIDELLQMNIMG